MKLKLIVLILIANIIGVNLCVAQIKVTNVEETSVKYFEVNNNTNISIGANKADIIFTPTSEKRIKITAVLSSKNKERQLAEKDLKKLRYSSYKKGNSISVINYIQVDKGTAKPNSDLHVYYTIEVPQDLYISLKVRNDFGKINLEGIKAEVKIESKFCSVKILNHQGNISINSNFGNVSLYKIKGNLAILSTRSEFNIENHSGDLTIKSSFSKLRLINFTPLTTSKIDDQNSEITISQNCLSCFYYLFELEKSEFKVPKDIKVNYSLKEENKLEGSISNSKHTPIINIKSKTGIISLKHL